MKSAGVEIESLEHNQGAWCQGRSYIIRGWYPLTTFGYEKEGKKGKNKSNFSFFYVSYLCPKIILIAMLTGSMSGYSKAYI